MRILFVSCNRDRLPDPVPPIGVAFLARAARRAGHLTAVLDACFEDDPLAALDRKLEVFGPDLVAISLRNLDGFGQPSDRSSLDVGRRSAALVREQSGARIAS